MGLFLSLSLLLLLFKDRASRIPGRFGRRLINLIFAGRNRMVMIRRELPLTKVSSPAEPVALGRRGFSFLLALAAAGSVLELVACGHLWFCFCFSIPGKFLLLLLLFRPLLLAMRQFLP